MGVYSDLVEKHRVEKHRHGTPPPQKGRGPAYINSMLNKEPRTTAPPSVDTTCRDPANLRSAKYANLVGDSEGRFSDAWSAEWAREVTLKCVRFLAENFPECGGSSALDQYRAEIEAAARGEDTGAYESALRRFAKAGKREALRIRREKGEAA